MSNLEYRDRPEPSSSTGNDFTREMMESLPRIETPPPQEASLEAYITQEVEKAIQQTHLLESLLLHFEDDTTYFKDDRKKISFVLSFMKKGEAAAFWTDWLENRVNAQQLGLDITNTYGSWPFFADKMEEGLKDSFEKETAKNEILTLKQGNKTAQAYFKKFEE
ncbi:hypothetical protein SERLADRAFT_440824 [Serpula lacrymans var. lacrymans S7.9]|uniref:Retrotransposon gag domain-containing protein n=1 Tax=Serpula lacrymans var. lacrymans (strain S7.9) TaxID=578457 RepID=F8P4M9_SERL9|nr:uncharacterized protein SERLADRAFT_440824 [Serpula lacrymans var. lacrymans S7.9]EGO21566.1 hypothetical protein SERLADRAFT_440824 [Serpula lacrymans var. lacrymans S7.9]